MEESPTIALKARAYDRAAPISPYLFIIVMSAMWADINNELGYDTREHYIKCVENEDPTFKELLYADDTLIFHPSVKRLTKTLDIIVRESAKYGMKLNRSKCEFLGLNLGRSPQWPDGRHVKSVLQAKYLGTILDHKNSTDPEISERIKQTMATWRRMDIVWKLRSCPAKTRILYWNMIIKTKLMYGLYLISPTKAQYQRLNALQNKGLRKILNLKTTYVDRRNSVEFIFQRANNIVRTETRQEHRAKTAVRKEANLKPTSRPTPLQYARSRQSTWSSTQNISVISSANTTWNLRGRPRSTRSANTTSSRRTASAE